MSDPLPPVRGSESDALSPVEGSGFKALPPVGGSGSDVLLEGASVVNRTKVHSFTLL